MSSAHTVDKGGFEEMKTRFRGLRRCTAVSIALTVVVLMPAVAQAAPVARLPAKVEVKALQRAFTRDRRHRGLMIGAMKVSRTRPAYAVVEAARPQPPSPSFSDPLDPLATITARGPKIIDVQRDYYREAGSRSHPKFKPVKDPPAEAKHDLDKDFWILVTYQATGKETWVDTQSYSESPDTSTSRWTADIAWSVAYRVDLDQPQVVTRFANLGDAWEPLYTIEKTSSTDIHQTHRENGVAGGNSYSNNCDSTYSASPRRLDGRVVFTEPGLLVTPLLSVSLTNSTDDCAQYGAMTRWPKVNNLTAVVGSLDFVGRDGLGEDPFSQRAVTFEKNSYAEDRSAVVNCSKTDVSGMTDSCSDALEWSGFVKIDPAPRR